MPLLCPSPWGAWNLLPWGPVLDWGTCPAETECPAPPQALGTTFAVKPSPKSGLPLRHCLSPPRLQTLGYRLSIIPHGVSTTGVPPRDLGLSLSGSLASSVPFPDGRGAQVSTTVAGQCALSMSGPSTPGGLFQASQRNPN